MAHAHASRALAPAAASFARRYAAAFAAYLPEPDETALSRAYELGRQAVVEGVALLDVCLAHHEALAQAVEREPDGANPASTARAAGDFLLEALASYEMVQRGFREAHGELELERRHASMVRRLSAFLADTSLAAGQADSLGETLRLVVEQARELLGANTCRGVLRLDDERHLSATSSGGASEAGWMNAREWADLPTVYDAAHTVSQRDEHVLRANLETLDGRPVGALIAESGGSAFTEADEAILTHLAQMASATIERAMSHRPPR